MSGSEKDARYFRRHYPGMQKDGDAGRGEVAFIVAWLLVLVARGDGHVSQLEVDTIISLVADHFNLQNARALERVKDAMQESASDPGLPLFMQERVSELSTDEKQEILIMLLQVARADGIQNAGEIRAINLAAKVIDLPPAQMHEAYQTYFSRELG